MLAVTASRYSPSDMWRKPKDEVTKDRLTVGSWRESRVSQESGEVKGILGNWRVRKQKETAEAYRPKVYGGSMPPEWKLVGMYKHFKVDNAEFTTWLVETVYPSVQSLPFYITLSDKQAKGAHEAYPSLVTSSPALTIVNRLLEVRHHRQQNYRACTPATKGPTNHGYPPRPPH